MRKVRDADEEEAGGKVIKLDRHDDFQANRAPDNSYRTTLLRGTLLAHETRWCVSEKMSTYWPFGKVEEYDQRAKYLTAGVFWWSSGDSNPGPPHCERGALPN